MTSEGHPQDDPWIEKQVADVAARIRVHEPWPRQNLSHITRCECPACVKMRDTWVERLARHLVANQEENLVHPSLLGAVQKARDYMNFRGEVSLTAIDLCQVLDRALLAVEAVGLPLVKPQGDVG